MSNVACHGSEPALMKCDAAHIPPDEGREVYMHVNVAGVSCSEIPPSDTSEIPPSATSEIPPATSEIPPSTTTSVPDLPNPTTLTKTIKDNSYLIGLCITVVLLVILIVMVIRYTILHHILQQIYSLYTCSLVAYLLFKRSKGKRDIHAAVNAQITTLSSLQRKEQEDENLIVLSNDGADDESDFEGIEKNM